jgi:hypothetical protein
MACSNTNGDLAPFCQPANNTEFKPGEEIKGEFLQLFPFACPGVALSIALHKHSQNTIPMSLSILPFFFFFFFLWFPKSVAG